MRRGQGEEEPHLVGKSKSGKALFGRVKGQSPCPRRAHCPYTIETKWRWCISAPLVGAKQSLAENLSFIKLLTATPSSINNTLTEKKKSGIIREKGGAVMSTAKRTIEEQIAELQKKQKELKEQEKRLRARKSKEERAKRTKHLIEMGGTIYSILGREYVEGDTERLAAFLKGQDSRGGYFSKAMNDFPAAPVTDPNSNNGKN